MHVYPHLINVLKLGPIFSQPFADPVLAQLG